MDDLLEDIPYRGPASSATVAMHTHDGMIREARIVDILISPGTVSHAFDDAREGVVLRWQRSRGFIQMVEVDSLAVDLGSDARSLDPPVPRDDAEVMTEMARAVAATTPAVAVERPTVPELGEEPIENLRRLFDLTYADIGWLFRISERHAYRWQREGVPHDGRAAVDALHAIGLTIIGGLGSAGAKAWLNSGTPTGAELMRAGAIAELAQRAEAEKESPYT